MRLILGSLQRYDAVFTSNEQELLRKAAPIHAADITFDDKGNFEQWHLDFVYDVDVLPVEWLKSLQIKRRIASDTIELLVHREQTVINQKVNVAVPGFGLLAMAHAMLASDCCTDDLNDYLNDGWRILAICPQPDQRRPDYILGKPKEVKFDF